MNISNGHQYFVIKKHTHSKLKNKLADLGVFQDSRNHY